MKCLSCIQGLYNECRGGGCTGSADSSAGVEQDENPEPNEESTDERSDRSSKQRVRRTKPDSALKDQQSTGRKRAARLYPLDRDADCEWRLKQGMGGGTKPIFGCFDGKQQARHHGPDKNTLNNDPGNVHRICHTCHNNWHAKNDPNYDPNKPLKD